MTIIKQKTKRQQRNEAIAVVVVGFALVVAMAEGVSLVDFFTGR